MNKLIIIFWAFTTPAFAQDTLLTYSKVIKLDSLEKGQIFDKTLVWCSKVFTDSKNAINVKEREGGLIAGKAYFLSSYKVPKKKDSIDGLIFNSYYFDWLFEIKENKLRFSISNLKLKELDKEYIVSSAKKPPYEVWLQPLSKTELEWKLSKAYLIINLDNLLFSLNQELILKKPDW